MQSLQFLIDQLTKGRNFHISIIDFSGILNTRKTKIKFKNIVHIKNFCNTAKSTNRGYRICQRCKRLANQKAIREKAPFCGYCSYGLYEVAHPVILNNKVVAIVYVGNAILNKQNTLERIRRTSKISMVNENKLHEELNNCETIESPDELFQIAELVSDYLLFLYSRTPKTEEKNTHGLVSLMKNLADEMFFSEITLKELAETYERNEKYMGRLFKKEMGITFSEYKQNKRLELAESLICTSNKKIIDIALECGFNNISYFNRTFQRKYGVSPTVYRKKQRSKK